MDRSIAYSTEQIRLFDWLNQNIDALVGMANYGQTLLGKTLTVTQGLAVSATGPASLDVNIAPGFIISLAPVDSSAYGSQPADTQQVMQLGYSVVTSVHISPSALDPGQSQYAMIQAGFQQVDAIAAGDPNGGVLPYININNPSQPFNGPNNSGVPQNTIRQAQCNLNVIYGAPATSGDETPPSPTSGYVPVALVDLAYGQTTITTGDILNPNNVDGSAPAPVLTGLLNSHHGGVEGQAPGIILTDGEEVQGYLPVANMVASNSIGAVASFRSGTGTPQGAVAGNNDINGASDFYWDNSGKILWVCDTTGDSSGAHWTSVSAAGSVSIDFNWQIFTSSGNYTPTSGTKWIEVTVVGGGGGGAGGYNAGSVNSGGSGGGGGGGASANIPISGISTPVTITVGTGGSGASHDNSGGTGGTSSFGTYLSGYGGGGGANQNAGARTFGGSGSIAGLPGGAQGFVATGSGSAVDYSNASDSAYVSGAAAFGFGGGVPPYDNSGATNAAYGGGGAGAWSGSTYNVGQSGAPGIVVVKEYIGP